MSKIIEKNQVDHRAAVMKKVDRWVARRRDQGSAEDETDWLGWDAWVRTAQPPRIHGS